MSTKRRSRCTFRGGRAESCAQSRCQATSPRLASKERTRTWSTPARRARVVGEIGILRQLTPQELRSPDTCDTSSGTARVPDCQHPRGRIFWLVSGREEIRARQTRERKPKKQSRRRLLPGSSRVGIKGTKVAKRWRPRGHRSSRAWLQPKYRVNFAPIYSSGSLPFARKKVRKSIPPVCCLAAFPTIRFANRRKHAISLIDPSRPGGCW